MNRKPKFIIVKFNCPELEHLLEGIRIISDPFIKSHLHLTVRGPYSSQLPSQTKIKEWDEELKDTQIKILGAGHFFSSFQSTIFLTCEANQYLRNIWMKPDFKEVIPHITLYDGRDRSFAEELLSIISTTPFELTLRIGSVESYQSQKQLTIFGPTVDSDEKYFRKINEQMGLSIRYSDISMMNPAKKLDIISKLWNEIMHISKENLREFASSY